MQLTATENYQPTPHMALSLTDIPGGAATVIVLRSVIHGESPNVTVVRGLDNAPIYGSQGVFIDWDCPLQTSTAWGEYRYTAQVFDGRGVELARGSAYVMFPPFVDDNYGWITNPYRPTQGCYVTLMEGTDETTEYPADASLSIPGWTSGLPSAAVSRRRRGGHRTIVARLGSLEGAELLEKLVLDTPVLALRAPNMRHPHGTMFLVPTSISEHRERDFTDTQEYLDGRYRDMENEASMYAPFDSGLGEETTWTIECDEVDGTRIPIVVNPWTYHDTARAASTYRERAATYPSYVDANRGDL
ncbi:hypothetical protein K1Y80_42745 [Streptomyces sp. MAG02]|nr:hypothetical protein [Streptomyces sp. MAG02]